MSGRYRKKSHRRVMGLFLMLTVTCAGALTYWAINRPSAKPGAEVDAIALMSHALSNEGLPGFQRVRDDLRMAIQSNGITGASDSLALYFFPDILDSADLEKNAALDLWVPLQKKLESRPEREVARELFTDLQATVWNYETADRLHPELTPTASEMLRLYDVISRLEGN